MHTVPDSDSESRSQAALLTHCVPVLIWKQAASVHLHAASQALIPLVCDLL